MTRKFLMLLAAFALMFNVAAVQAEEEATGGKTDTFHKFSFALRGGWNTFLTYTFEDVGVESNDLDSYFGGLEFSVHLDKSVYFDASVEFFSSPSDAAIELEMIPLFLNIRAVFDTDRTKTVRPYAFGGVALYFMQDEAGVVTEEGLTSGDPILYDPDSKELLTPEGDVWFSQRYAFGLQAGLGADFRLHDRVSLYVQLEVRTFGPNRKFNTYHFPAAMGLRVYF